MSYPVPRHRSLQRNASGIRSYEGRRQLLLAPPNIRNGKADVKGLMSPEAGPDHQPAGKCGAPIRDASSMLGLAISRNAVAAIYIRLIHMGASADALLPCD